MIRYIKKILRYLLKNFVVLYRDLLLGTMALIVSIHTCQIDKREMENNELLNMPIIEVESNRFSWDEHSDSEEVIVKHSGKLATFHDVVKKIFLKCSYMPYRSISKDPEKIVYIPISNILGSSFPKYEHEGIVTIMKSYGTRKYVDSLIFEATNVKGGYLEINLLQYVVVKYSDFRDNYHEDVFLVNTGFPSTKVPYNDELKELFKCTDYKEIQELTIEKIIELIKTEGKEIEI